jgi:hypothetical protein
MFQFSNLLGRENARLLSPPRGRVRTPHTPAIQTTEPSQEFEPSESARPDRVRRELDEQMQRLTQLLDHVESLEFEREALGPDSKAATPVVPEVAPTNDDLNAVVFDLHSDVASDLTFESDSELARPEAIDGGCVSVDTEEVIPHQTALASLRIRETEPKTPEPAVTSTEPVVIPSPSPKVPRATPATPSQTVPFIPARVSKPNVNRRASRANAFTKPASPGGFVQDYSCDGLTCPDEPQTLQIFDDEPEPEPASLSSKVPPAPPHPRADESDRLDPFAAPAHRAPGELPALPFTSRTKTPDRAGTRAEGHGHSSIALPLPRTPTIQAERPAPIPIASLQSVVHSGIADSPEPQIISVAPPTSGVILLKTSRIEAAAPRAKSETRTPAPDPDPATLGMPVAAVREITRSPSRVAASEVDEEEIQLTTDESMDELREITEANERHGMSDRPSAFATVKAIATNPQLLNVLAVIGGLITLALLAYIATDWGSWF